MQVFTLIVAGRAGNVNAQPRFFYRDKHAIEKPGFSAFAGKCLPFFLFPERFFHSKHQFMRRDIQSRRDFEKRVNGWASKPPFNLAVMRPIQSGQPA